MTSPQSPQHTGLPVSQPQQSPTSITIINTGGGPYIDGNVNADGDFIAGNKEHRVTNWGQDAPSLTAPVTAFARIPHFDPAQILLPTHKRKAVHIKNKLLAQQRFCVICGMPGIGKKFVAKYVIHLLKEEHTGALPNDILWINLSRLEEHSDPETRLKRGLQQIAEYYRGHDAISEGQTLEDVTAMVRQILAAKSILLVIHDVRNRDELKLLRDCLGESMLLVTTTTNQLADPRVTVTIHPPTEAEAVKFLQAIAQIKQLSAQEHASVAALVRLVGCHPFALDLIGREVYQVKNSLFQKAKPFTNYLNRLKSEAHYLDLLVDSTKPEQRIEPIIELSYQSLTTLPRSPSLLFEQLGVFSQDEISLWMLSEVSGLTLLEVQSQLSQLELFSLLEGRTIDGEYNKDESATAPEGWAIQTRCYVNPIIHAFARKKLGGKLMDLQERLLDRYLKLVTNLSKTNYNVLDLEWLELRQTIAWALATKRYIPAMAIVTQLSQPWLGTFGFLETRGYGESGYHWVVCLLDEMRHLTTLERSWLLVKAAAFALARTDYDAVEQHQQAALSLCATLAGSHEVHRCKSYAYYVLSQLHEKKADLASALICMKKAIDLLDTATDDSMRSDYGGFSIRVAALAYRTGSPLPQTAEEVIQQALAMLPTKPTAARVSALFTQSNILWDNGVFVQAKTLLEEAADMAEQMGNTVQAARYYSNFAGLEDEQGLFTESERHYQEAIARFQRIGDVAGACIARTGLVFMYINQGAFDQALTQNQVLEEAIKRFELKDVKLHQGFNYCRIYLGKGQVTEARYWLQEAKSLAAASGDKEHLAEIAKLEVQCMLN